MRALVVDDELVSREKMKRIMTGVLGGCDEASSGPSALDAFEGAFADGGRYDLITLDISMPEMDGLCVLTRIRELERERGIPSDSRAKIFMVTSSSDRETIVSCIRAGCNDYITKPFSTDTVVKKLRDNGLVERGEGDWPSGGTSGSERPGLMKSVITAFNKGEMELPAMPLVQIKFYELMGSGPTLAAVADLLGKEPAIATKLIGISNSSFYRGYTDNATVEQAVNRLGLVATRRAVDAMAARALYDEVKPHFGKVVEMLWEHSLACAFACQSITELKDLRPAQDPFTMGLLHDIGKLMLLRVIMELERGGKETGMDALMLMDEIQTHHAGAGAVLMKKWLFPAVFEEVARLHDEPGVVPGQGSELPLVQLANLTVKSMGYGVPNPPGVTPDSSYALKALGFEESLLTSVKERVGLRMDELMDHLR